MSQYFYKIFIFSRGWSQFYILLFYFDLAHQNYTVDEQWKTLYEQWQNIVAA